MLAKLGSFLTIGTSVLMLTAGVATADIVDKLKTAVAPKSLEEHEWIEVQTENFRIRSTLNEKDSIKLARDIENANRAFSAILKRSYADSPIPLEIIALENSGQLGQLGINPPRTGGIFLPGLRRNSILIHDSNGFMEESEILAREYTHFLMGEQQRTNYPQWYKDGFAEMLSTVQEKSGRLMVGAPPPRLAWAHRYGEWVRLRQFLDREYYSERSVRFAHLFHLQAWALVRFLHDRPENETLDRDLARYIELLDAGKADVEAFESAFDVSVDELDAQIRKSLSKGEYNYLYAVRNEAGESSSQLTPEVVVLSPEQVSLTLGRIALLQRELNSAQHWFSVATGDRETRPQAAAGLGDVYRLAGYIDSAESSFATAVELAPEDPYCALDFGKYWHDRAKNADNSDERLMFLSRARKHFVHAWKLDDSKPEPYILYGQTFLTEGDNYAKAIETLEFAEGFLPSNLTVRVMLAQAYAGAGRYDDAAKAAHSAMVWSHESSNAGRLAREIYAQAIEPPCYAIGDALPTCQ